MILRRGFLAALLLAALAHLAPALAPPPTDGLAGGDGAIPAAGDGRPLSLAVAGAELQSLAEAWSAPPERAPPPAAPPPLAVEAAPAPMASAPPLDAPPPEAPPPPADAPPEVEREVDRESAEPPSEPEPGPEIAEAPAAPPPRPRPPRASAPDPAPAAPAAAARVAESGGGAPAGGSAARPALSDAEADALRRWGLAIRATIERRAARRARGDRGRVVADLSVTRTGALRSVRLARSSGSERFDRAALALIEAAAPFPPAPAGVGETARFTIPIERR